MKKSINSKKAFAMLLILSFAVSIVMTSSTTQAQGASRKTYPFIDAIPNPVGVGSNSNPNGNSAGFGTGGSRMDRYNCNSR